MLVLLVVVVVAAIVVAYKLNQKKASVKVEEVKAPEKIEPIAEVQVASKPKKAASKKVVKKEK